MMKLINIYCKRYAGVLALLLVVGALTFTMNVFASESASNMVDTILPLPDTVTTGQVDTITCANIITDAEAGTFSFDVVINAPDDLDTAQMAMNLPEGTTPEYDTSDTDFNDRAYEPFEDNGTFWASYKRTADIGPASGELTFVKVSVSGWDGSNGIVTFDEGVPALEEGSLRYLVGTPIMLTSVDCVIGNPIPPTAVPTVEPELPTIAEIAVTEGFTTLVTALDAAGLAPTFADATAGPFTVFAPLETAFAGLPEGTLDTLLADPNGLLTDILNYHVVDGVVSGSEVIALTSFTTLFGEEVTVSLSGGAVLLNDSALIVRTDIEASNGVVHVIDAVLLPPTAVPTAVPTDVPTAVPTDVPTAVPTDVPTAVPTDVPTAVPTDVPTAVPTDVPTAVPTDVPTAVPTDVPTETPIPPTATSIPPTATPETVTVVATQVVVSGTIVITGTVYISVTVTPSPTDIPAPTAMPTAVPEPTVIPEPSEPTLFDLIAASPDHTVLEQLLIDLNMQTLLNGLNSDTLSYTVFAPDDETLQLYLDDGLLDRLATRAERNLIARNENVTPASIQAETDRLMRAIILNHVVSGVYDSAALLNVANMMTPTLSTLDGDSVNVSIISGTVDALLINDLLINGQSVAVTVSDIPARNGVLHVVHQEVILPSSVGLGMTSINNTGLLPLFTAVALIAMTSTVIGVTVTRRKQPQS